MLRDAAWRDAINIFIGFWLIASPTALAYRSTAMIWSDLCTGIVVVVLALLTLRPACDLLRWGLCACGMWLLCAPLLFWATEPAVYLNDTLAGALLITFSVIVPMMPGRAHHHVMMMPGPLTPPGWSYNPSGWLQRAPIVAMAFLGFFLSRHLAAFQLGHIPWAWDPFFGDGTRRVLESEVSRSWPVSDAGLGAVAYMIEALSGLMGGTNRWRTMPWMVAMFGVLVVPLGVVSIVLVILQPVAVGAWCTLCLATAAAMLVMIAPALDEVVAMAQFLAAARREGRPFWRTFWIGGTLREAGAPAAATAPARRTFAAELLAALDLAHVPWNMLLSAAAGVWVMAAPAVLGSTGASANSDHLAGALIVTWSVIAFGEIARPVRWLNLPMGLWLAAAAWLLDGGTAASRWNDAAVGLALILLCMPRGRIEERFGAWNRYLA
jgi:hypothetical protein